MDQSESFKFRSCCFIVNDKTIIPPFLKGN